MNAKPTVGILGAGFAGLEAAFSLRYKLGDQVDLTLISDRPDFLFKPNTIYIPFGADPAQFQFPLSRPASRKKIELLISPVREIDPDRESVRTDTGAGASIS